MDYQDFVSIAAELINKELSGDIRVEETFFIKNNGVCRRGITFYEKDINASPTIYLESFYDSFNKGADIDSLIKEIIGCYYKNRLEKCIDVDFFSDYEMVKEKLFCRVINTSLNREFLEDVPHEDYLDLSVIVYCSIDDSNFGNAMVTVHNKHLDMWDVDCEELIGQAKDNTRYRTECCVQNISSVIGELMKSEMTDYRGCSLDSEENELFPLWRKDEEIPMFVVSNRDRQQGAVYIIFQDMLRDFAELFNGDYYVLPSSIHEVILIPVSDEIEEEHYNDMVKEVNSEHLEREEILSDHAYRYSVRGGFLI